MEQKKWRQSKILGVKVDFVSLKQAVSWVEEQVKYNKKGQIVTPNPEHVVLAQKDKEFFRILNNADLTICDGTGLVWAIRQQLANSSTPGVVLRLRHTPGVIPWRAAAKIKRISGTDLMLVLTQKAAEKGWRVFLLGGKKGIAQKAARKLATSYPRQRVGRQESETVCHCEERDPSLSLRGRALSRPKQSQETARDRLRNLFSSEIATPAEMRDRNDRIVIAFNSGSLDVARETKAERERIIKKINQFKPHLLFVAYGAPYQEKWIAKNLPKLKVNIAMGVGGAFDYLSGKVPRAPKWIRSLGLEWLWRLFCQPWRIKRQLRLIEFVWLVLRNFILHNPGAGQELDPPRPNF